MALDLGLYLNTHPCDREALSQYNQVAQEAEKARAQYERAYGKLYAQRACGCDRWTWPDDPWPWCESANFCLWKEVR
jgi:spore coat protein JB